MCHRRKGRRKRSRERSCMYQRCNSYRIRHWHPKSRRCICSRTIHCSPQAHLNSLGTSSIENLTWHPLSLNICQFHSRCRRQLQVQPCICQRCISSIGTVMWRPLHLNIFPLRSRCRRQLQTWRWRKCQQDTVHMGRHPGRSCLQCTCNL